MRLFPTAALLFLPFSALASDSDEVWQGTLFHASFDKSEDADLAKGDARIYTADSLERKQASTGIRSDHVQWNANGGRRGGALNFISKSNKLVFFKAGKNVPYSSTKFSGTISLWMRLSPKQDLPEGYVDPLQITDKKWNDAAFFIDFDREQQRDFRLGVFSDFAFWNPQNRKFDDIPVAERPMVTVKDPPFSRDRWTHVAFTWQDFNSDADGVASFYLNGKLQGRITDRQQFTWRPEEAVIMLGINYVGQIDDLMILDRALTAKQIQTLAK